MADKNKMPHLPPVPLAKKEEAAGPFPAVKFVSVWVLSTSFLYTLVYAMNRLFDTTPSPCDPCIPLTDADAAKVDALANGMMWCAAPQAAAAALALWLLPCRRRWMWLVRRALAYAALAAAIVSHLMYTSAVRVVLAADPWNFSFMIPCSIAILTFADGDLLSFLALLLPVDLE
ncbi:unnamed protein product [Urochloa decumbens]|uniref:Uncharacterized protein n=1 Tax=Urochloa decumbens TaxID=240449 RepID=A0ABC9AH23_9POAL